MSADSLEELSEKEGACPPNLQNLRVEAADGLDTWADLVKDIFRKRPTFADLGRHLNDLALALPTSLGNFIRSYCCVAQPLTTSGGKNPSHGDLLPVPTWEVTEAIDGITKENREWVRLIINTINFHYCTGWTKPICTRSEESDRLHWRDRHGQHPFS